MFSTLSRHLVRPIRRKAYYFSSQLSSFDPPRLFDYETIKKNLTVQDAISSVEAAFAALATEGSVDVPMPMHINVPESENGMGPGDCHIKGGYIVGTSTFTVKLATVSFYKNLKERNLPPGAGTFCVVNAQTGATLGIFQENRYLTDLRTGAAGAVAIKHCTDIESQTTLGFVGCGAIARNMARAAVAVNPNFKRIVAFGLADSAQTFCTDMKEELGLDCIAVDNIKDLVCQEGANVIFTQTPGGDTVLELDWLQQAQESNGGTGITIIASGSDQPTKQELPTNVLAASKYISDLTKQTSKVGELRSALEDGSMKLDDVHAELGQIVKGDKPGREGNELIVVDLTGTGAQDAAIGQVAWDKLSQM